MAPHAALACLQAGEGLLVPCRVALEGVAADPMIGAVSPLHATATSLLSAPSVDALEAALRTADFTLSALDRVREILAAPRRVMLEAVWRIERVWDIAVNHGGEMRHETSAGRGCSPPPRARIRRARSTRTRSA